KARYFAQADDFSVWDIGDVHLAKERQKVVLAQAEHFDVFHDHHLVVADREQRLAQERFRVVLVALDEKLHGLVHARGCARKAFAIGIFAEADKHFAHQFFIAGAGQGVRFTSRFHRFLVVSRPSLVDGRWQTASRNDQRPATNDYLLPRIQTNSSSSLQFVSFLDAPCGSRASQFRRSRCTGFPWSEPASRILKAGSDSG